MTKSEFNSRLVAIQTRLVERNKAEDIRHNAELGHLRSEFRQEVNALRAEYAANADGTIADLREMGTTVRPA